ncbi:MAG: phosphatase PAP2 family protein [Halovenus sp.]
MARGIGELNLIRELLPDWLAVVFALLTQLGDLWFLVLLWGSLYWLGRAEQDDIATVGGLSLAGVGLNRGLKAVFGLPRPAQLPLEPDSLPWLLQSVWELTTSVSSAGFPSGHATNSTVVYFGLACVLAVGTRRRRLAAAGLLAGTVSLTRVALGVHFLVDVVAGFFLGLGVLVVGLQGFANRAIDRPTLAFALAVLTGLFNVIASNRAFYSLVVLGGSVGAFAGWQGVLFVRGLLGTDRPSTGRLPTALHASLLGLAMASLLVSLLVSAPFTAPAYAVAGVTGFAVATVVLVPPLRHSARLGRVFTAARFWLRARWPQL